MASALRVWSVTALLVSSGCRVGLTDPVSGPLSLTVLVSARDDVAERQFRAEGRLTLPPAFWDTPDAIHDAALIVNDSMIQPAEPALPPRLSYEARWEPSALAQSGGTVTIRPPEVMGVMVPAFAVAVPVRVGDADLVLPPGDDLILTLAEPPLATSLIDSQRWQLDIRANGQTLSVHSTNGLPGTTLTIPGDLLESLPDAFLVTLNYSSYTDMPEETSYRIALTIHMSISWQVTRPAS